MNYVKRPVIPDYSADSGDSREIGKMRAALHWLQVNSNVIKCRYFVYEPGVRASRRVNYAHTMTLRTKDPGKIDDVSARTRTAGFDYQQDSQTVLHA